MRRKIQAHFAGMPAGTPVPGKDPKSRRRPLYPLLPLCFLHCITLLSGCTPGAGPDSHKAMIIALGTLVNVEIIATDDRRAEQAVDELRVLLTELGRDWYGFGDGELGRVNAALAGGGTAETTPDLSALIARSLALRALSDGLFDPAVGNLVKLWGFADFDAPARTRVPPSEAAIEAWRRNRARLHISVSGQTINATDSVTLDLGGIAKGTVLARATALLERLGIHDAMIDAGGDIRVMGTHAGRPWRVGIRDPRADGIVATISLAPGESIVTSGNYERYFNHDGHRYQHVLNPLTGRPVESTAGVTVIHTDPELADAAATALMVAGPDRFSEIAGRMGITAAVLIDTRGGMYMTPAMARRMDFAATDDR